MVGLSGIVSIIVGMEGVVLLPILTKTLGVYQYGVWALVNATIILAGPVATLGLRSGVVRLLAGKVDKKEISIEFFSVFAITLIAGVAVAASVASASNYLFRLFGNHSDAYYFVIGSFMIILWAARSFMQTYFQTFRQVNKYATYTILYVIGEIGFASFLVLSGYGLSGAIIGVTISNSIVVLLMISSIRRQIGFEGIKFSSTKEYLAIGLPLVPMFLFGWIVSSSDKYFIGIFKGASMVGIYSTTYAMTSLLTMFVSAIIFALDPTISKLWDEEEPGKVKEYLSQSLKYSMLLTIPSAFGLSVLGENILQTVAKPEFVPGAVLIPVLSIGMISSGVFNLFLSVLVLTKKTIYATHANLIAAFSSIALNIILVPLYGIWGAAISSMAAYMSLMLFGFYFSRKYLTFDMNALVILKSTAASIIMSLVILQLHPAGIFELMATVGTGAIVYGIVVILVGGITREELVFFWTKGLELLGIRK